MSAENNSAEIIKEGLMTAYTHFVKDFSDRCANLLTTYFDSAQFKDREVTLMLSIAAAGFTIPFERLRPPAEHETYIHPSGDRLNAEYQPAVRKFDHLFVEDNFFRGSEIWSKEVGSWCLGKVDDPNATDPDAWEPLAKPISEKKTTGAVLKILRNAVAHGNILTRGTTNIDRIVFLSSIEGRNKFSFITISPSDFYQFLLNWFNYLSSLDFPQNTVETAEHRN
jgi:hypothetical protein